MVGVQPFGGEGPVRHRSQGRRPALPALRLLSVCPQDAVARWCAPPIRSAAPTQPSPVRRALADALATLKEWARRESAALPELAAACGRAAAASAAGLSVTLPGPTGERNTYTLLPRAAVLCLAQQEADLATQLAAVPPPGSQAVWPGKPHGAGAVCTAAQGSTIARPPGARTGLPATRTSTRCCTTAIPTSCAPCASNWPRVRVRSFQCKAWLTVNRMWPSSVC
ncbi:hypothetical protein ACU4GD_18875 [Cupriavidus basilensis]